MQLPDTPQNRAFLKDWLQVLIAGETGQTLSPQELDVLQDAIIGNYETPFYNRRLSHLAELLSGYGGRHDFSLAKRLQRWHSHGDRAWLFDNVSDALMLEHSINGFDLTSILDDKSSRTPWLMYIFHRINQKLDGRKTIIMLDEGWKLLDDPAFAARIKDWMKTIRKQNGIVGFATQSAKDAITSSVGDAIIEQSPTQIFLPNSRARPEDYCSGFGLSRHELNIIRGLSPESRSFLLKRGKDAVIARLDLGGMDEFVEVLSGKTETVTVMEQLIEKHGDVPEIWLEHFTNRARAA